MAKAEENICSVCFKTFHKRQDLRVHVVTEHRVSFPKRSGSQKYYDHRGALVPATQEQIDEAWALRKPRHRPSEVGGPRDIAPRSMTESPPDPCKRQKTRPAGPLAKSGALEDDASMMFRINLLQDDRGTDKKPRK